MKRVLIKSSRFNYPVYIGRSIINRTPAILSGLNLSERVFVLTDKKVDRLYGEEIKNVLNSYAKENFIYSLSAGEKTKSLNTAEKIFNLLLKQKFGRDTLLLTIGGGTIGDIGGFVASTYMRGVQLVHIPTTILAAVDSSIGGKTGVNFLQRKNLIGTFYQPKAVIIDTSYFNTLDYNNRVSGFGEVIKYAYLSSDTFYNLLYSNFDALLKLNSPYFNKVIEECISIKAAVVSQDEFETSGIRKILNFGHTFAHAFESYSNYRIDHGRAVLAGIIRALFLSYRLNLINQTQLEYYLKLPTLIKSIKIMNEFNRKDSIGFNNKLLEIMYSDKKSMKGQLSFVLIAGIGKILIDVKADKRDIFYALNKCKEFLG
jgi:3-dehydroquinate synthase